MSLFHRKAKPAPFDTEKLQPAVRKSYCNREMTLGFLVKESGQFRSWRNSVGNTGLSPRI